MRTYYDCYPCFLCQALNAARRVDADDAGQFDVLQRVLALFQKIQPTMTPPEIVYHVHRIVRETVDCDDPFQEAKVNRTKNALALYQALKRLAADSEDALDTAIRISIAGNIIDFGVMDNIADLPKVVERVLNQRLSIDDIESLRRELSSADHVLFLGDNAGETVFDRILIETLPKDAIYAVKAGPILNDATMEDAIATGLDHCATLVSSGSDAPGTILEFCSETFRQMYQSAPVVIAKGQSNYETLSESDDKGFCLLWVKYPVIARDVGAPADSIVVCQTHNKAATL